MLSGESAELRSQKVGEFTVLTIVKDAQCGLAVPFVRVIERVDELGIAHAVVVEPGFEFRSLGPDTVDPPGFLAPGISGIEMAQAAVAPVSDIDGAVRSGLGVDRAEPPIGGVDEDVGVLGLKR